MQGPSCSGECSFSHHQRMLLSPNIIPREKNEEAREKKTLEKCMGYPTWSQIPALAYLLVFTLLTSFSSLEWASKPVSHRTGGILWLGITLQSRSNDFQLKGGWWLKTCQLETLADDLITPSILRKRLAKDPNKSKEHMGPNTPIWVGLWLGSPSGSRSRILPYLCNRTKLNCRTELQSMELTKCKGGFLKIALVWQ